MMHTVNSNPKGFGQIATLYTDVPGLLTDVSATQGVKLLSNNRNVALEINQAGVSFVSSPSEIEFQVPGMPNIP